MHFLGVIVFSASLGTLRPRWSIARRTDKPTEKHSDTDRVGKISLEFRGLQRLMSFPWNEDNMLSSSQFVSNTWEVHLLGRLSYVSLLKFYVLIGLGRLGLSLHVGWAEK